MRACRHAAGPPVSLTVTTRASTASHPGVSVLHAADGAVSALPGTYQSLVLHALPTRDSRTASTRSQFMPALNSVSGCFPCCQVVRNATLDAQTLFVLRDLPLHRLLVSAGEFEVN